MSKYFAMVSLIVTGLSACGCSSSSPKTLDDWIRQNLAPPSPNQRVAQAMNVENADDRYQGILALSKETWGRKEPYLKAYALLCRDEVALVRSAAVIALGRAGEPAYLPTVLARLEDESPIVRTDAAAALASFNDPTVMAGLGKAAMHDSDPLVRAACIRGLNRYPQTEAYEVLLACLADNDFGVRHSACETLRQMTGLDGGYRVDTWRRLLNEPAQPEQARRPWWDWLGLASRK